MTDKKRVVQVGMFAFATGVLLAIVLIVFGGLHFWRHRHTYYIEYPDSVIGLSNGVQVYFNGIRVGNVTDISVASDDLSKVRVAIEVDASTPVRTDTIAKLDPSGITGLKVIDLHGGAITSPELAPGSMITPGRSTLDKLAQQAETIADQSAAIVTRTKQILDSIDRVVANLQAVSDPAELGAIVHSTRQTSESLAHTTHQLDVIIAENRSALHDAVASVARSTDGANQLVGDLRTLVRTNGTLVQSMLFDARQAARTLKEVAHELREKPSRLLFSDTPAERKLP